METHYDIIRRSRGDGRTLAQVIHDAVEYLSEMERWDCLLEEAAKSDSVGLKSAALANALGVLRQKQSPSCDDVINELRKYESRILTPNYITNIRELLETSMSKVEKIARKHAV